MSCPPALKIEDFDYPLPERLIARYPSEVRGEDRLLFLDRKTGSLSHRRFSDLPQLLPPGSLLVFNDSRVRKARIYGHAETRGRGKDEEKNEVCFLLARRIDAFTWEALTKRARRVKEGTRFVFGEGEKSLRAKAMPSCDGGGEGLRLVFDSPVEEEWLERHGHIPLPPYIRRVDESSDARRYQTIYAKDYGSSAAPTAGLHFTDGMFAALKSANIETAFVTLHVGLGTFLPVRPDNLSAGVLHEEAYTISAQSAAAVNRAKREDRPVIAVGTTSLRTLESAWGEGGLKPGTSATSIFIYPPYSFRVISGLVTNFHTPRSSLLMLVSALVGREHILAAYEEAVKMEYRFFSYGDAMLIL